jgi:NAD+ synthase (glutamine-hydrolysing)
MNKIRIALAQINTTVGDVAGNTAQIIDAIEQARSEGAQMVAFSELAITGYPPEDLLYKPALIAANERALETIAQKTQDIVAIVGFVERGEDIFNAAAVIESGRVVAIYRKHHLPNYGVFDEERYFQKGREIVLLQMQGYKIAIAICEDLWFPEGPMHQAALQGAEVVINLNASPFSADRLTHKTAMLQTRARDSRCALVYVNQVGGQDELVFSGESLVISAKGEVVAAAKAFEPDLLLCDLDLDEIFRLQLKDARIRTQRARLRGDEPVRTITLQTPLSQAPLRHAQRPALPGQMESIYRALCLGLKDYIAKNGFEKVVFGLSGGIDSALVAAIAVDALGPDRVMGVMMPSPHSSEHSLSDSIQLAQNLGFKLHKIPIEPMMNAYEAALKPLFGDCPHDTTEENIQARIRGQLLMAISNKFGHIVLATGNKSEMSVGYATLYGDMVGGFALLKDVLKTTVYALCRWRNQEGEVIPENILTKPPSAELRPDQRDQDELPDYDALDRIIRCYIEEDLSLDEMDALGINPDDSRKIIRLINQNEYKRHQAPVGIKITERAFGRDRRMPITHRFRE